jgi:hypothetical protein
MKTKLKTESSERSGDYLGINIHMPEPERKEAHTKGPGAQPVASQRS